MISKNFWLICIFFICCLIIGMRCGYERAKPKYWSLDQIKRFGALCRYHNKIVMFKLDPEYIRGKTGDSAQNALN